MGGSGCLYCLCKWPPTLSHYLPTWVFGGKFWLPLPLSNNRLLPSKNFLLHTPNVINMPCFFKLHFLALYVDIPFNHVDTAFSIMLTRPVFLWVDFLGGGFVNMVGALRSGLW